MSTEGIQARRALAGLIAAARRAARMPNGRRMTQDYLAKAIGCTQSTIQKYEAADTSISPRAVTQIIKYLAIDPDTADRMSKLAARNAVGEPWTREQVRVAPYAQKYITLEQEASEVRCWHELRLPGPLQSEFFMLNLFKSNRAAEFTDYDVAPYIRSRRARKKLFLQSGLKSYDCILSEALFWHFTGSLGKQVVRDEIDYLLDLNDPTSHPDLADERTSVRLLPFATETVDLPGDFSIVRFSDGRGDIVYHENATGSAYVRAQARVEMALSEWQNLDRTALDRDATNAALRKLRADLTSG